MYIVTNTSVVMMVELVEGNQQEGWFRLVSGARAGCHFVFILFLNSFWFSQFISTLFVSIFMRERAPLTLWKKVREEQYFNFPYSKPYNLGLNWVNFRDLIGIVYPNRVTWTKVYLDLFFQNSKNAISKF
jgi:hypothetical protein